MRVLVGGGNGFVGSHLARLLRDMGHEMINVSRKAANPREITWERLAQHGLPEKVDAVLNLAGVNIGSPVRWTKEFENSLISSRVDTTRILCDAIEKAKVPPKTFIAISAIGYYGMEDRGVPVTELSPAGGGFLCELASQVEEVSVVSNPDIRSATVRIGIVLGRDGGMIQNVYWPYFAGVGGTIGDGKQWFPWIHADDVAGILFHCIENRQMTGIFNAVAPESATNEDFTREFSKSMCRFAVLPVPKRVFYTLLGDVRGEMMTSSPLIIPERTLQSGYKFKYPDLKSACADCVQWGPY